MSSTSEVHWAPRSLVLVMLDLRLDFLSAFSIMLLSAGVVQW